MLLRWRHHGLLLAALLLSLIAHAAFIILSPGIKLFQRESKVTQFDARVISPPALPAEPVAAQPVPIPFRPRPVKRRIPVESAPVERVAIVENAMPPNSEFSTEPVAMDPIAIAPPVPISPLATAAAEPARGMATSQDKMRDPLPTRIAIAYDLKSSLVDGRADYLWRRQESNYTIDGNIEANGFFATMFVGRLEQKSRGELTPAGLRPELFSIKRGESPVESAEFKWDEKQIKHNRLKSEHTQPLNDGAQDLLSFIFQFAYVFSGKPSDPSRVTFFITNARKMDRYEFRVIGTERLTLPIGEINALHIIRQTSDPTEAYEAWLATDYHHVPVKLRFMLGGRVNVEQIAVSLRNTP